MNWVKPGSQICALSSHETASVLCSVLMWQLLSIHYGYMPCPGAISNRERKIKMQTINFNTKALWKRRYNKGLSVSAYKEGIPNSAWGEHWVAQTVEAELFKSGGQQWSCCAVLWRCVCVGGEARWNGGVNWTWKFTRPLKLYVVMTAKTWIRNDHWLNE